MSAEKVLKDNSGQVLLMVIITSTIALFIVTGVFLRVLRLNRRKVELESHEAAFAMAEQYSRKILNEIDLGYFPDQNWLDSNFVDGVNIVAATVTSENHINDFVLEEAEVFSIAGGGSGDSVTFDIENWGGASIILTSVRFDSVGGEYSVGKVLFKGCTNSDGDLSNVSCSNDAITYSCLGDEVAVRIRSVENPISIDVAATFAIANEYIITTREEGVLSEVKLIVNNVKSVPTIFDHVLYNGVGVITK